MESAPKMRKESGYLNGRRHDIEKVYRFAETIPVEIAPLAEFQHVISEDNDTTYEIDGQSVRPYEIVRDWDAMQMNPVWQKHVHSITRVDLDKPILVSHSGHVLDGQHRIIRSFVEGKTDIKVKRLPQDLPADLEMNA